MELLIFLFLSLLFPSVQPSGFTLLPLTPTDPAHSFALSSSHSASRAHHLKHRPTSSLSAPLIPRSYGGYSFSLTIGTPPQSSTFVMDTGSSLVWFPCTTRYTCLKCTGTSFPPFIPKNSSSAKIIGCRNPKCHLLNTFSDPYCPRATSPPRACSPYSISYGQGSTSGLLLSDSLSFPNTTFTNIAFGCSILSTRLPGGIAGFGRSNLSLPSQLGLAGFAYCLVSHRHDDKPSASSNLVLFHNGSQRIPSGLRYTSLRNSPNSNSSSAQQEFYYVYLRSVLIGRKAIKIPRTYSVADGNGDGGTIIDSGSTFTYMEREVFERVAGEFTRQMVNFTVADDVENQTGLRPCFHVTAWPLLVPRMTLRFKGGARTKLPLSNYFPLVGYNDTACLIFVTGAAGSRGGPSIILGNYQQMNFYVHYDLVNRRVGFKRHDCLSFAP